MMGTGWEVNAHLTPSVITILSGAEHLGEVNSWSGSQERSTVNSSSSERKEQQGRGQASSQVASRAAHQWFCLSRILWRHDSTHYLESAPCRLEFQILGVHLDTSSLLTASPAPSCHELDIKLGAVEMLSLISK